MTRHCETVDGVRIHPAEVLAMSAVGWVRRRVVDAAGVTINLSRRSRLFTGAARQALRLTDCRCGWNGCTVAARNTQADHTVEWGSGGPSNQSNGGLQCPRHNRYKNHGYTLRRDHHGTWHTYRPDGSEVGRPHPPPTG